MRARTLPQELPQLDRADLFLPVERWTAGRKHRIVRAVINGILTRAEAISAHGLSEEELDYWIQSAVGCKAAGNLESMMLTRRPRR